MGFSSLHVIASFTGTGIANDWMHEAMITHAQTTLSNNAPRRNNASSISSGREEMCFEEDGGIRSLASDRMQAREAERNLNQVTTGSSDQQRHRLKRQFNSRPSNRPDQDDERCVYAESATVTSPPHPLILPIRPL